MVPGSDDYGAVDVRGSQEGYAIDGVFPSGERPVFHLNCVLGNPILAQDAAVQRGVSCS